MKVSYNWLKEYLDFDLSPEELAQILTDTGLEVEGVSAYPQQKSALENVVVGKVVEVSQHPNADRLKVTKVDVGSGELLNIVCGAANVAADQKVIVACVGAVLQPVGGDELAIRKSKIRGEVSEGMICAEDELGLSSDHAGIMVLPDSAVPGTPAAKYFNHYRDWVLEIGLTPNRTDAMSHFGVARDLAARINLSKPTRASLPQIPEFVSGPEPVVQVVVENTDACPRYSGLVLQNVKVGPSPDWLQNKLKAIGLQPKNVVVDVTNFVLHEVGYPLHAFDLDKIKGEKIVVRNALSGETLTTLDGSERKLDPQDLVIADTEKGLALAGVMGGANSGVSEKTTSVFIESAWFNPVVIRKAAKRHAINSDASYRFERGVDPQGTLYALKRAADLICRLTGASVRGGISDQVAQLPQPQSLHFDLNAAFRLIGKTIPENELEKILNSLDIEIEERSQATWKLILPPYRIDVTRQVDVVEEVLRIYGYNRVEIPEKMQSSLSTRASSGMEFRRNTLADFLASRGFLETMSNGLTQSGYADLIFGIQEKEASVSILNPLSQELNAMRRSLLGSALENVAYNQNRQVQSMRFFEMGRTYQKKADSGFCEKQMLSLTLAGHNSSENWNRNLQQVTFFDLAAEVEAVLSRLGIFEGLKNSAPASPYFQDGIGWFFKKQQLVALGWVKKQICEEFDIKNPVLFAEFDLEACLQLAANKKISYSPPPKFPAVRRDLSLLLEEAVSFAEIEQEARKAGGELLREVGLFDVYTGKNLPDGKKSYALNFMLQDENATLTDKRIDKTMGAIQKRLEEKLGASLRG